MLSILSNSRCWFIGMVIGAFSACIFASSSGTHSPATDVFYGLCIGSLVVAFDQNSFLPGVNQFLRKLTAPAYLLGKGFIVLGLIVLGHTLAGIILFVLKVPPVGVLGRLTIEPRLLFISLAVGFLTDVVQRIKRLMGGRMFCGLLLGKYYKPVQEDRIFLIIDLVGSTALTERLGDLAAQEVLGHFLYLLGEPVKKFGGTVDRYIGDQAIISWPSNYGRKEGRCFLCLANVLECLNREQAYFKKRYGVAIGIRAAYHAGPIVTAEVGDRKHEISYFGDTINTAARLESFGRNSGQKIVASERVLAGMVLPENIQISSLGRQAFHGKEQLLEVFAIRFSNARC